MRLHARLIASSTPHSRPRRVASGWSAFVIRSRETELRRCLQRGRHSTSGLCEASLGQVLLETERGKCPNPVCSDVTPARTVLPLLIFFDDAGRGLRAERYTVSQDFPECAAVISLSHPPTPSSVLVPLTETRVGPKEWQLRVAPLGCYFSHKWHRLAVDCVASIRSLGRRVGAASMRLHARLIASSTPNPRPRRVASEWSALVI